jgi:hypothetical protein
MKSEELSVIKFSEWIPFGINQERQVLEYLPESIGVYIIRTNHLFGRLVGESDIIYIGSAINNRGIRRRVKYYFHPGPSQQTSLRINKRIPLISNLEISYVASQTKVDARVLEKQLLLAYEKDHLELPPFNRQE